MMSIDLSNRLREVYLSGRWIANTNCKQELDSVHWQQAVRQIDGCNSIAMLTSHLNYYIAGILDVMDGKPLTISDKHSFDMLPINHAERWDALRQDLYTYAEAMAERIEALSAQQLQSTFVDSQYGTWQHNLEALIEHGYYHLGQIVLLKKMLAAETIK